MSANGVTPFFDNVIQQNVMGRNEFAFYFNSDDKAGNGIFWGGVDPSFYEGEIRMFPVTQPYYWAVDLHKFMIGNKELSVGSPMDQFMDSPLNPLNMAAKSLDLNRKPKLIVDSGTTYFTAENGLYQKIMSILKSAPCNQVSDATHPPLTYQLVDAEGKIQDFVIPSDEYMVSDEGGHFCEPAFMKIDIPKKYGPGMLLGEVFMRNYFTVFDRGDGDVSKARIGFARAKKGPEVTDSLLKLTGGKHSFKSGHAGMPLMQSIIQKAESAEAQKFHHKPGLNEGSSQLQTKEKKRFRVNPWMKAK
jgi:pepsin A